MTKIRTLLFADGAELRLIRVIPDREVGGTTQSDLDVIDVARTELSRVATVLADTGAAVSQELVFGDPAGSTRRSRSVG